MDSPARILIADDDSTFLNSTAALIRREGYRCDCAGDSGTALSMLDQDEFDLLLADINMPGNPCLEMVERVAHTRPGLPVILLTGYPTLDSALRSRELPVIAYLLKPAPFGEMLRWVEQLSHPLILLKGQCTHTTAKIPVKARWASSRSWKLRISALRSRAAMLGMRS